MPFCSKCGFEVDADDNFCARCGYSLKQITKNDSAENNNTELLNDENTTIKDDDQSEENFVDWMKKDDGKKNSFWKTAKQSLKHIFFDSEEKFSKNRKIVNFALGILILIMVTWIVTPYLSSVNISIGENGQITSNGACKYRLDATGVSITDVKLLPDNLTMQATITNDKNKDIIIERIAKTYEFKFDGSGDTDIEELSTLILKGQTLKLTFSVKRNPYILGFDFSNCEKKKVSEWKIVTS